MRNIFRIKRIGRENAEWEGVEREWRLVKKRWEIVGLGVLRGYGEQKRQSIVHA